jgi:hypothetical protein
MFRGQATLADRRGDASLRVPCAQFTEVLPQLYTRGFPNADDTRRIMDIRRSGAVEAAAGQADPAALAAKMGNSIDKSKALQNTYLPKRAATVRLADEARRRGGRVLSENE